MRPHPRRHNEFTKNASVTVKENIRPKRTVHYLKDPGETSLPKRDRIKPHDLIARDRPNNKSLEDDKFDGRGSQPMTPTALASIGLLEQVTICPARPAPRVDIGRELDRYGFVSQLGLIDHGSQEALCIVVVITAPNFDDARQQYHLPLMIPLVLYAILHHADHSISDLVPFGSRTSKMAIA
jgi:hypothetical protein